jgi:hypothetical protein
LVRYLTLVLGSNLVLWMALVTSGEFGFEREVIEKATLDRMPIPDFRKFNSSFRAEINRHFNGLQNGTSDWPEIDRWVSKLYGLGKHDLQVIADTLEFNLPFAENKRRAQELPSSSEIKVFCDVLREELAPWCKRFESSVAIASLLQPSTAPWLALELKVSKSSSTEPFPPSDWQGLLHVATETAASEVIVQKEPDELLIGRLAQRRYWTKTQARLLAQRIVWAHIDVLKGQVDA